MGSFTGQRGRSLHEILYRLEEDLDMQLWKQASTSHNGAGLDQGLPNYEPAARAHAKLIKAGGYKEAKALELIINNKIWSKQRLLEAGIITDDQPICERCAMRLESTSTNSTCVRPTTSSSARPSSIPVIWNTMPNDNLTVHVCGTGLKCQATPQANRLGGHQ